jgi:hypothetical protein
MESRAAASSLWRAARAGFARFNQLLAEVDLSDDAVFQTPPRTTQPDDVERRIDEARQARLSQNERHRSP